MNNYFYFIMLLLMGIIVAMVLLYTKQARKKTTQADSEASAVIWGTASRTLLVGQLKLGQLDLQGDKLCLRDTTGAIIFDEKVSNITFSLCDVYSPALSYWIEWRLVLSDGRQLCLQMRPSPVGRPLIALNQAWLDKLTQHTSVDVKFGASPTFKRGQIIAFGVIIVVLIGWLIANSYFA